MTIIDGAFSQKKRIPAAELAAAQERVAFFVDNRNQILNQIRDNHNPDDVQKMAFKFARFIDENFKDTPIGLTVLALQYSTDLLASQMIDFKNKK